MLLLLQPVGWTVTASWSILHVLHKLCMRQMFREAKPFNGFPERCQEESVPLLLLGLVSMILEGPSIKDQMADTTTAALTVAKYWTIGSTQADTWHIISQRQAQHCTGDTSSNLHRDDVACSYMQEGTNRHAVTPGY